MGILALIISMMIGAFIGLVKSKKRKSISKNFFFRGKTANQ
jgi:hypothetical protein